MHFGERIRQSREIRGWTQDDLALKIKRSKSLIAQIEAGFRLPSQDIVEAVALATKLPITYFNEEPHAEFPIAEVVFRAPRSIKRRDVLGAVRYAEHVFSIYSRVAERVKEVPCLLPEINASPEEAARAVRKALGISASAPMTSLIRPLERAGVAFVVLPKMESGDAFSVWINHQDSRRFPVIAYTIEAQSVDRARLSIAHELGHLVMHQSFLRKAHAEIEDEAFAFGAELLMPEAAMRSVIHEPVTLTSLSRLKPLWGVSIASLIVRAMQLRIITQRQYHYLFQQLGTLGWKTREPEALDLKVERPRLFRKMVEIAYGSPINFGAFASDTRVSVQELRTMLADYEGSVEGEPQVKSNVIRFSR